MILSFIHKGLEKYYKDGNKAGIQPEHSRKLTIILTRLNAAKEIEAMNDPGFNLHELSGKRKGIWSVKVNGNWRVTFEFRDGNAYILNYEDYHSKKIKR